MKRKKNRRKMRRKNKKKGEKVKMELYFQCRLFGRPVFNGTERERNTVHTRQVLSHLRAPSQVLTQPDLLSNPRPRQT